MFDQVREAGHDKLLQRATIFVGVGIRSYKLQQVQLPVDSTRGGIRSANFCEMLQNLGIFVRRETRRECQVEYIESLRLNAAGAFAANGKRFEKSPANAGPGGIASFQHLAMCREKLAGCFAQHNQSVVADGTKSLFEFIESQCGPTFKVVGYRRRHCHDIRAVRNLVEPRRPVLWSLGSDESFQFGEISLDRSVGG